jgi:hypothetical protein
MRPDARSATLPAMRPSESPRGPSYAVAWREGDGPAQAGKLELDLARLRLEGGRSKKRVCVKTVLYDTLSAVRPARPEERRAGHPALVLERSGSEPLWISSMDGPGASGELLERVDRAARGGDPA